MLFQPRLSTEAGAKGHRDAKVVSTTLLGPMSRDFVAAMHAFAEREGVEIAHFVKYQRKDEVTQERLKDFKPPEGVLYIGVAQEKFSTFRSSMSSTSTRSRP